MKRLRSEDGIALVSAIIVLMVLLGLGAGLLLFTDQQSRSATYDQSSENAFALAEAALNAQIYQLSVTWPATAAGQFPVSCNPTTGGTVGCPNPTTLQTQFPTGGSPSCPANTPKDAWGSSLSTAWTTYVRDDTNGSSSTFSASADQNNARWDQGGSSATVPDGALWVRAVGVSNCRTAVVLAKVSAQKIAVPLPQTAVDANGFATSNNGNKIIVDTLGTYAQPSVNVANPSGQPGPMSMRCTSLTANQCKNFRTGQVIPFNPNDPAAPSSTLSPTELQSIRYLAMGNGTWWGTGSPNGTCPSKLSQLTGAPTYIDGPCNLSFTGNDVANTSASPGFTVLANGTMSIGGTTEFFGVVYAVNQQGASGTPCDNKDVITVQGNGEVQGAIIVDGNGTVCFGSSGNGNNAVTNFVYDIRGFSNVFGWAGAAATPNSFRQLPQGQ